MWITRSNCSARKCVERGPSGGLRRAGHRPTHMQTMISWWLAKVSLSNKGMQRSALCAAADACR